MADVKDSLNLHNVFSFGMIMRLYSFLHHLLFQKPIKQGVRFLDISPVNYFRQLLFGPGLRSCLKPVVHLHTFQIKQLLCLVKAKPKLNKVINYLLIK